MRMDPEARTEEVAAGSAPRAADSYPGDDDSEVWVLLDAQGRLLARAGQTSDLLGMTRDHVVGDDPFPQIHPDDWAMGRRALERAMRNPGTPVPVAVRVLASTGQWHDFAVEVCDRRDDPRYGGIVVSGHDVTERRLARIAARVESTLLATLPTAVIVTDADGLCVYWNEAATEIYGYRREDVVGRPITDLNVGPSGPEVAAEIMESVLATGRWEGDYDARRADGSIVPVHTRLIQVEDPDIGFRGIAGASIDISDRRRLEEELAFQALHDDLTGLPNRRLFLELAQLLAAGAGCEGVVMAFLDVDGFGELNDAHGPVLADEVLRRLSRTLAEVAPKGVAGRIDGDEFVVCVPGCDDASTAGTLGRDVAAALAEPRYVMGERTALRASIGVASAPTTVPVETVLRRAHAAMFEAKRRGGDRVQVFDPVTDSLSDGQHSLALRLGAALDAGELDVAFQPQIDMGTGTIVGFEALARWGDGDDAVDPNDFIPVAEQHGLIDRIGELVLRRACEVLADISRVAPERPIAMSVNVSPRQLDDPTLPQRIASVVEAAEVPAGRIILEVTESALVETVDALRVLRQLKAVGVGIAIDDFGTGCSSLSRLSQFPLDHLKIDRSFVDGLLDRAEHVVITSSIINLASTLGITTVAEGVQHGEQVGELLGLGCRIGQGFLWSPGVPADEALAMLTGPSMHHEPGTPRRTAPMHGPSSEATIDDAIGLLAHELAQPAQVITGFAELVRRVDDDEVRQQGVDAIVRAAGRVGAVVDLVRQSRALALGALRVHRVPIHVAELVERALDEVGVRTAARDRPQLRLADVELEVDPDLMVAVVANLVANAHRHTPPGSGIELVVDAEEDAVQIHVLDDGPGVPPEQVGLIFRRFGRANRTVPGSGLGLYVARGIARAHGGDVAYRPRPTGGADFYVTVPLDGPARR